MRQTFNVLVQRNLNSKPYCQADDKIPISRKLALSEAPAGDQCKHDEINREQCERRSESAAESIDCFFFQSWNESRSFLGIFIPQCSKIFSRVFFLASREPNVYKNEYWKHQKRDESRPLE